MLWPAGPSGLEAEAEFLVDGRTITAVLGTDGTAEWTGRRPWTGPEHLASRYDLGLLDLTLPADGEDVLAREVRRQMAGGFDLDAVRGDLFAIGPRKGENVLKHWVEAADRVRRVIREQESLAERRDRLDDLRARLARAEEARKRREVLTLLHTLAECRLEKREAEGRLAGLPAAMARVREDDPRVLADLRRREAELVGEVARLADRMRALDGEMAESGGGDPDPGLARRRWQDWRDREGELVRARREAEEARARAAVEAPARPGRGRPLGLAGLGILLLGIGVLLPGLVPPWPTILTIAGGALLGGGAGLLGLARGGARRTEPDVDRRRDAAAATAREESARRNRDEARDRLVEAAGPVDDVTAADRRVEELEARRDRRRELDKERAVAGESLRNARGNLDRVRSDVAALLDRLDVKTDAEVAALAGRLDEWKGTQDALRRAEREIARLEPEVAAGSGRLKEGERDLPPGRIGELIADEEARADEAADLQREIVGIEKDIEHAVRGHDLEDALAARAGARADLAEARDTVREAVLGGVLVDEVSREYETAARPAVLREADRLLGLFTGNRYELRMAAAADGPDRFLARPTDGIRPLELGELSDGTRAQLLLAVRLAFLASAEDEARPPLFLDDALTSADPERFAAVAAALGRLAAEEGRQVFYLTPNPADAAAFRRALADAGLPAATHLDLARARGLAGAAGPASLDPANLPSLERAPDPTGLTAPEYAAALQVPRTDPWADPGALHVFHLAQGDLPLVRRLVDAGAATWGRFRRARQTAVAVGDLAPDEVDRVAACGEVWEAWLDAWRIGRAAPVTREFLAASDAVSDKFIDKVAEVLEELGKDGASLLAAIEDKAVPGFRTSKIDQLRDELLAAGLLDDRDPFDEADLELAVLDRVASRIRDGVLTKEKVRTLVRTFAMAVANRA